MFKNFYGYHLNGDGLWSALSYRHDARAVIDER